MPDHQAVQAGRQRGQHRARPPSEDGGRVRTLNIMLTLAAVRLRCGRNVQRRVAVEEADAA